jgi:hypothetical protein
VRHRSALTSARRARVERERVHDHDDALGGLRKRERREHARDARAERRRGGIAERYVARVDHAAIFGDDETRGDLGMGRCGVGEAEAKARERATNDGVDGGGGESAIDGGAARAEGVVRCGGGWRGRR